MTVGNMVKRIKTNLFLILFLFNNIFYFKIFSFSVPRPVYKIRFGRNRKPFAINKKLRGSLERQKLCLDYPSYY